MGWTEVLGFSPRLALFWGGVLAELSNLGLVSLKWVNTCRVCCTEVRGKN